MSRKESRRKSIGDRVVFVRMFGYVRLLAFFIVMWSEILARTVSEIDRFMTISGLTLLTLMV